MLTKKQAKLFFLGGTALFSGVFILMTIDLHRKVPEQTNSAAISDDVKAGKRIWEDNNCMGCHTLFGEGAYYAPELTKVVERRGKEWIRIFIKDPEAMFPNQRKMVKYDFSEQQIDQIIAFLEWCGHVDLNGFPAKPPLGDSVPAVSVTQAEAFSGPVPLRKAVPEVFTTGTCIGCHQIQGQGGAAAAAIGAPPLDDVFRRYTREKLIEWISDPQKIKPGTKMPKLLGVAISEKQLIEIADYLMSLDPATAEPPASGQP
ncbi:MAG: c-type cytochrome [Myxococcales bacterium]|nr:MAG: c-type cytochrome [Myxococcales bacterium]